MTPNIDYNWSMDIGKIRNCSICKKNYKHFGQKQRFCKPCRREYNKNWHRNQTSDDKHKRYVKQQNRLYKRIEFTRRVKRFFGCADCGVKDFRVLDFNHLPQFEKSFGIGLAARQSMSIERLKEEIRKCEVVCSNCHRIRSYKRAERKYTF